MSTVLGPLLMLALTACRAVPPEPPVAFQDATVWRQVSGDAGYLQFATRGEFGDLLVVVRGDKVTALLDGEVLPDAQVERDGERVIVRGADGRVLHEVTVAASSAGAAPFVLGARPGAWAMATGERRKLIGVTTSPADGALKAQLGVEGDALVIETVSDDMPAAKAGLQPLDVVVAIEGQPGATTARLREVLEAKQPGDTLGLSVRRRGEPLELSLVVEPPRGDGLAEGSLLMRQGEPLEGQALFDFATQLADRESLAAQRAELDARLQDLRAQAEALAQRSDADALRMREELAAREAQVAAERALLESRLAPGTYTMTLLGDGEARSLVLPRWSSAEAGDDRMQRLEERLARLEELLEKLAARQAAEADAPADGAQPAQP